MARGDIHLETGTICKAQSDESCPYGGGHAESLEQFAGYYDADLSTLKGLVENGKMNPKAALDLMGEGIMEETPTPLTSARLVELLGPIPDQSHRAQPRIRSIQEQIAAQTPADENRIRSVQEQLQETPQERYDREMTDYKIAMVKYEDRMLEEHAAAQEAAKQSPFAPRPQQPPFRTVYPKSFEAYDQVPKEFLSEETPAEIAAQTDGEGLWEEYLRKRKQLGDVAHVRGDGPDRILYL